MRHRRTAAALLLTLAALLAPLSPAAARTAPADRIPAGTVTVPDGRTLFTDADGRTLQLRGFNLDKYAEARDGDLRAIAADGFSLVRIAVSWSRLEPAPGRYDRAELARVRGLLDSAQRAGLLAVVDFHQDVYGPAFGGGDRGVPRWATRDDGLPFTPDPNDWFAGYFQPAVQAAFRHLYDDADLRRAQADLYTTVARALRGHPALLGYDLFNEPFGPVDGDPADPAVLAASSAALERGRLARMYRRLIDAVRRVDDRSWLFVEPTVLVGQGVPTALPRFADPRRGPDRIGYAPHFYDTAVEAGRDWDESDGFVAAYTAAVTGYPRAGRLPVLVGEWGPPTARTPGNAALVARQVEAMRGFAAGWTLWYWCRGDGGYCALGPDGRPAPGYGPAFGPYPAAAAGVPVAESFDGSRYTLRLTADGSGRTTEITVPAGAFPHGLRAAVDGALRAVVEVRQPAADRAGTVRVRVPGVRPGTQVTVVLSGLPALRG
ncbi:glycoside hydrolase family 5 protein [Kitasatospora sp. NPDC059571]|uniref:glycoside hydrolase family 5 protein n=1 Tax=Kitasatospora sp. NPDC059571 TaxID=3346871 RepID=UPI0036B2411C